MGGGWNVTGPGPSTFGIGGVIELEWHEANQPRRFRIELLTDDGRPVEVQTPVGQQPVVIETNVEVGRPPGVPQGTAFNVPIALNIVGMPRPPGARLVWRFTIDGESREECRLPFLTRPAIG